MQLRMCNNLSLKSKHLKDYFIIAYSYDWLSVEQIHSTEQSQDSEIGSFC